LGARRTPTLVFEHVGDVPVDQDADWGGRDLWVSMN
jgi:hypothetical protein